MSNRNASCLEAKGFYLYIYTHTSVREIIMLLLWPNQPIAGDQITNKQKKETSLN